MERGAPLARTPLTSTWSGADTASVSPVSTASAEVRRVARTGETSATSPSTSMSAARVCPTGRLSMVAPLARSRRGADLFLGDGTPPAAAPRDQGGRQHLANEAV